MLLYKFKALNNTKHVLDIILYERLFCSEWKNLNDPNEGRFSYYAMDSSEEAMPKRVKEVIKAKCMQRVCSLSSTIDSHLLWAHYADGFRGVAIGIDVPDGVAKKVVYTDCFTMIDESNQDSPNDLAYNLLRNKFRDWKYEKEWRIIQESPDYKIDGLERRVIFGHRIDKTHRDALQIICEQKNIPTAEISIGFEGEISVIPC